MTKWLAENWLPLGALAIALAGLLWNVIHAFINWQHDKTARASRIKVTVVHRPDEKFRHPSFPDRLLPRLGPLKATVVNVGAGDLFLERPYIEWHNGENAGKFAMKGKHENPIKSGDKRIFYLEFGDPGVLENVPHLDRLPHNAIQIDFRTHEGKITTVTGDEFVWLEPEIDPKTSES